MSINHYSSDTPQTSSLWWTQQQYQPTTFLNSHISNSINPCFNLNNNQVINDDDDDNSTHPPLDDDQATPITAATPEEEEEEEDHHDEEKEGMFEKALTPSDVGKLNRLVIPKQHAEKYFPLGGDSVESKGLLLSFEDESGKCWRFRYSYWNSSQSYVLTKGWSRYVKDKRLDAGDVVLFQRHRAHANRLFIRWRRRQPTTTGSTAAAHISQSSTSGDGNGNGNGNGVGGVPVGWPRGFYSTHPSYPMHHHPFAYQPADSFHAGGGSQGQNQTTPVGNGSSSRVLRLFGVNMECQPDNDSETLRPECSYNIMSSTQGTPTHHFYHHQPS